MPFDDKKVKDGHLLIRRINPVHHIMDDEGGGGLKRFKSMAFKPSLKGTGGMSADWMECLVNLREDPRTHVIDSKYPCAVSFTAGDARSIGLSVGHTPTPDNECHVDIWNVIDGNRVVKFSASQSETLIDMASWFVPLDGVMIRTPSGNILPLE